MRKVVFILCLLCSVVYSQVDPKADYFPLAVGNEWVTKTGDMEIQLTIDSFAPTFKAFAISKITRIGSSAPIVAWVYYENRNKFVICIAASNFFTGEIERDDKVVFKRDYAIGSKWESYNTNTERSEYQVIGFDSVTVAAGTFRNVLVLEETLYRKETKGSKIKEKVYLKARHYYAPNIGEITNGLYKDNKYTPVFELASYKLK